MTGNAPRVPRLSVVIPSFERPAQLHACLDALALQQLPPGEFEVIVVDDGSVLPPRALVKTFAEFLPVRLIEQRNAGPAAARNAGARAARAAHVVFTDDDCRPDPQWLAAISTCITAHPDAAVGGQIVNALPGNVCSTASQLLIEFLYRHHNDDADASRFLISANIAVARKAFLGIGGFDESFPLAAGEDRDFCERWLEVPLQLVYCPQAVVHHAHDLGITRFCRQHFNYGRGAHHLHSARARRGMQGFRVESLAFYRELILAPYHTPHVRRTWGVSALLSALLGLSQLSYAVGYALERWNARVPALSPVRS